MITPALRGDQLKDGLPALSGQSGSVPRNFCESRVHVAQHDESGFRLSTLNFTVLALYWFPS